MALFFKSEPSARVRGAIAEALAKNPSTPAQHQEWAAELLKKAYPESQDTIMAAIELPPPPADKQQNLANQLVRDIPSDGGQKFAWERLILAAIFLAVIFGLAIYTSHDDKMQDFTKPLLGTFTTLLGAVAGLITGEASSKK